MAQFPITKKDKLEIIQAFLEHLDNLGVSLAEECEEDGKVVLEPFKDVSGAIATFLAGPKTDEEE